MWLCPGSLDQNDQKDQNIDPKPQYFGGDPKTHLSKRALETG
jgi:hypothetical protein